MASNPSNQNDVLTSINRFITIQSEDRRIYMDHCRRVMNVVLASLEKSSDLFKKMSKGIEFSGSYRDNLKVSKPDEYDINLKMKLPLRSTGVIVAAAPNKPGYVRINIKDLLKAMQTSSGLQEAEKELAKLTDDAGNLLQNKWLSWFEGKLFICKDEIEMNLNTEYILKYTKSGPAHTINVTSRNDFPKFSIDFVIGITFDLSNETWRATRKIPISSKPEDNYWISIPKPNKDNPGANNPYWIASYPAQENRIIHDKNRLKDAIRFIKKLRDHQNLQNLKSFYIKNVVMLEVDERHSSYWNNPIATVVKDMLTAVRDCLVAGKIPSYWNSGNNLIGGFSERQNKDIAAKLSSILWIWTTSMDREQIMRTILTDAEIEELNFNIRGMANLCLVQSDTAQQDTTDSPDKALQGMLPLILNPNLIVNKNKAPQELDETCTVIIDKFRDLSTKVPSEIELRYNFHSRFQKDGESLKDFMEELQNLAKSCDFGDLDNTLRDRFVCGIKNDAIRKVLLKEKKLSLLRAFELARAEERILKRNISKM